MVRKLADGLQLGLIYFSAFFSVVLLAGILAYVLVKGVPTVNWTFLTSVPSTLMGTDGIAGNLVNTVYMIVITLCIVVPLGIGSAVWLNEYAGSGKFVKLIEFATETLAAIPSVVFGLFGMVFFGTTLNMGYSILTGAFTLTLMVLPLITRNTQEALRAVPDSYRAGAAGMGVGKWYMIRTILLPVAAPAIVTGVILAAGRIVGESAALLLTAGSGYLLPKSGRGLLYKSMESGGTLSVQLYLSMSKAQYDTAFGIAVVLLCFVFAVNCLTRFLVKKLGGKTGCWH